MDLKKEFKTIIAVPARLNSSRLPKKVLENIGGKPMLIRVLEQCKKAIGPSEVLLCTDSEKLSKLANSIGIKSLMTGDSFKSGSERIASRIKEIIEITWEDNFTKTIEIDFLTKLKQTFIINVQADQPFLDPSIISKMHDFCKFKKESTEVVTPIYKLKKQEIHNESIVKTLINHSGQAIYFSRSPLPFIRDQIKDNWHLHYDYFGHVGIYGYRADILSNWFNYPSSKLEESEKLEQLKLIDSGIKIGTFFVEGNFVSIDTQEQLEIARNLIKNKSFMNNLD